MQFTQAAVQQMMSDPANADAIRESKTLFEGAMKRATTDREFRQLLVDSPNEALAAQYREIFGREIPTEALSHDIRFVEPKGDFTYVLPQRAGAEAELSEAELATVAGGGTILLIATYAAGVAVTAGVVWVVDQITDEPKTSTNSN